ncbi:MAG: hypothetical protein QG622_3345 [Actinomycetota bacterium]|nr:hypothetical protein [Actinomycetota bacterium]
MAEVSLDHRRTARACGGSLTTSQDRGTPPPSGCLDRPRTPQDRAGRRAVVGVLPDGTVYFVPRGEVRRDRHGLCCHLCGFWFRSLDRHLATHGWSRERYVTTFALGDRPRFGEPVEDRVVPSATEVRSQGSDCPYAGRGPRRGGRWRHEELVREAAAAARRLGVADVGDFVVSGIASGLSLAELSLRAGMSRRWLDRHLSDVVPDAAERVTAIRTSGERASATIGLQWLARLERLGFTDPQEYLDTRRAQRWTLRRIAEEGAVTTSWLLRRRELLEVAVALAPGTSASPRPDRESRDQARQRRDP